MQDDYAKHDDMSSLSDSNTRGVTAFPPKRNLAPRFHDAKEAKKTKPYMYKVAKKSGKFSARKSSDSQVASSSEC